MSGDDVFCVVNDGHYMYIFSGSGRPDDRQAQQLWLGLMRDVGPHIVRERPLCISTEDCFSGAIPQGRTFLNG
jgi:hypothetical protein